MKVLYIIDELGGGGAERQLVELVKGMTWRGVDAHVVCLSRTVNSYMHILQGIGVHPIEYIRRWKADPVPIMRIRNYAILHKVDLLHTFMAMGSAYGVLAAWQTGIPVICSAIRDARDLDYKQRIMNRFAARTADILVANSWAGLHSRFSQIRPSFRVIHNGIDFNRFTPPVEALAKLRLELRLDTFQHVIGMVGSLSKLKDQETLIRAAQRVLKEFPATCFLIIGDGFERTRLEELVKDLGLADSFLFLGFRSDVDWLYHLMDISVLLTNTTIISEGTPNAILEAMACGVAVIASESGGVNEVIHNGENGLMVPPKNVEFTADAVISLLRDPQRRKKLGEAGRASVQIAFSIEGCIESYLTIYKEVVLPRPPTIRPLQSKFTVNDLFS